MSSTTTEQAGQKSIHGLTPAGVLIFMDSFSIALAWGQMQRDLKMLNSLWVGNGPVKFWPALASRDQVAKMSCLSENEAGGPKFKKQNNKTRKDFLQANICFHGNSSSRIVGTLVNYTNRLNATNFRFPPIEPAAFKIQPAPNICSLSKRRPFFPPPALSLAY